MRLHVLRHDLYHKMCLFIAKFGETAYNIENRIHTRVPQSRRTDDRLAEKSYFYKERDPP
jgi:hypothetical protein